MATSVRVTDPANLEEINGLIHDQYFDIDDARFDPQAGCLTIRFGSDQPEASTVLRRLWIWRKVRLPLVESFLRIRRAKSCEIRDTAQVGTYPLNIVEYNPRDGIVDVIPVFGADIKLSVEALDIEVELTDKVIGHLVRSYFGRGYSESTPKLEKATPQAPQATQPTTAPDGDSKD
jgi:hypothetical protein